MKNLFLSILLVATVTACESNAPNEDSSAVAMIEAEDVNNFNCINAQADNAISTSEAKTNIVGEWQLKAILTMIPNNEVPNIVLKVNNDLSVTVTKAGKKVHEDKLKISKESGENYSVLKIESSRGEFSNGDFNFLYGNLRVCEKELFIDNGVAFDAPGYFFRKM